VVAELETRTVKAGQRSHCSPVAEINMHKSILADELKCYCENESVYYAADHVDHPPLFAAASCLSFHYEVPVVQ